MNSSCAKDQLAVLLISVQESRKEDFNQSIAQEHLRSRPFGVNRSEAAIASTRLLLSRPVDQVDARSFLKPKHNQSNRQKKKTIEFKSHQGSVGNTAHWRTRIKERRLLSIDCTRTPLIKTLWCQSIGGFQSTAAVKTG